MEHQHFDRIARLVGAAATRRQMIRLLIGSVIAGAIQFERLDVALAQDKGCCRCLNRLRTRTTCTNEIGQRECKVQCEATDDDEVFFSRRHVCSRGAEGNLACRFKQPTVEVADAGCADDAACPDVTFCAVAACAAVDEDAEPAARAFQDEPVPVVCLETTVCCSEGDRCGSDGTLCCADGTYYDEHGECVGDPLRPEVYDPVALAAGVSGSLAGFGAVSHSYVTDAANLFERNILPQGDPPNGFIGVFISNWALADDDAPGNLEYSQAAYLNTFYFSTGAAARDFFAAEVGRTAATGAYTDVTGDAKIGSRRTVWTGGFPYAQNVYLNRALAQWNRENVVDVFTWDTYTLEPAAIATLDAVTMARSIDHVLRDARTGWTATNRLPIIGEPPRINVNVRRWKTAEQPGYGQSDETAQRDALFAGDATSVVQINYETGIAGHPLIGFGSQLEFPDEQAARGWLNGAESIFVQLDEVNGIPERQYLEQLPDDLFGGREFSANVFLWNVPSGLVSGMESRVVDGPVVSTFAFVNPRPLAADTRLRDLLGPAEDSEDLQLIDDYLERGYSNSGIYFELFGGDIGDHPEFLAALIAHRAAYYADVPVQESPPPDDEPPPSCIGQWIQEATTVS